MLLTFGLSMVAEQLIRMTWGSTPLQFMIPSELKGQIIVGDFIYSRYRLLMIGVVVLMLGVSMVPLNTRFKASEVEFVLKKSAVKALFFRSSDMSGKDYAALLAEVVPELAVMVGGMALAGMAVGFLIQDQVAQADHLGVLAVGQEKW